jgi:hypothetical protein
MFGRTAGRKNNARGVPARLAPLLLVGSIRCAPAELGIPPPSRADQPLIREGLHQARISCHHRFTPAGFIAPRRKSIFCEASRRVYYSRQLAGSGDLGCKPHHLHDDAGEARHFSGLIRSKQAWPHSPQLIVDGAAIPETRLEGKGTREASYRM